MQLWVLGVVVVGLVVVAPLLLEVLGIIAQGLNLASAPRLV